MPISVVSFRDSGSTVMRDDFPTGAHEYIPLNPSDTFPATQREIYLVFGLVSDHSMRAAHGALCVESSDMADDSAWRAGSVLTSMSDRSGYFLLTPPTTGWVPGPVPLRAVRRGNNICIHPCG